VDPRRLKPIDWLTGLLGAALIGLLWAPWYRTSQLALSGGNNRQGGHISLDAWRSMAVNDVILCIAGLLGIWLVVMTATHSTAAVPIASAVFATFVGLLAFILSAIRLIFPPDLGPGPTGRAAGVWLGVAAAIGVAASAALNMRDERRGAPGSYKLQVTELPAPRVEGT
jgi:hypothetical protein